MIDCGAVSRFTEIALESPPPLASGAGDGSEAAGIWRGRVNRAMALLANATRSEGGAIEFCGRSMPDEAISTASALGEDETSEVTRVEKPAVTLLLSRFLLPNLIKETTEIERDGSDGVETAEDRSSRSDDPYQHFAAVLMNATQIEQGRRFVTRLTPTSGGRDGATTSVLQTVLPQLGSPNPVRRRGVAGTMKNCCFDRDSSWWLLNEVRILTPLLYPLCGPEELDPDDQIGLDPTLWLDGPDKVREPDSATRLLLVESVLLLCATGRRSRELLRKMRTYVVLKIMDMVEEVEDVSDRINECVQYLRRDEEGTEEGSSDKQVAEAVELVKGEGNLLALPAPSASSGVGRGGVISSNADYNDVD